MRCWQCGMATVLIVSGMAAGAATALAQSSPATVSPPGTFSKEASYPTRPVRLITGAAGSTPDVMARQVGQQLSERWGQSVVVENRGGTGLTIGTAIAAKAVPDGYTLLMSDRTAIAVAPSLYKNLPYVPLKDLAPITLVVVTPSLLVAHPSFPASNLREFIDHAKRHPGAVNMAVAGPGTGDHIATELFKHMSGVAVLTVPYKSDIQGMMSIISGETKAGFKAIPTALPHVKSGKVKAYASTGRNRFAGTPDIPTLAEAGVPGYHAENWAGVFAPAGVPAAFVARLNRQVVEILQAPAIRAALLAEGAEPSPKTPADFSAFIVSETPKMKKIIDLAGVLAE